MTAKWLEPRSIYTAKVRLGKSAAQQKPASGKGIIDDILVRDFSVVSAADHYSVVLKALLSSHSPYVYLVDDKGKYVGVISAERATDSEIEGPLDTTTASDLAQYIAPLTNEISATEARSTLDGSSQSELPVIDRESGEIVGVLQKESR